jgi:hypothetical protein
MQVLVGRMVRRKLVVAVAFAVAFVINPGYFAGCIGDSEPNFGEPEMLDALAGANAMGPWRFEQDGARYEAELVLTQQQGDDSESAGRGSPLSTRALACSSRTFMQSAAACVTASIMPLDGTLTLRRVDQEPATELASDLALEGELAVYGLELGNAYIHLEHGFISIDLRAADGRRFELMEFHATNVGTTFANIAFSRDTPPAPSAGSEDGPRQYAPR